MIRNVILILSVFAVIYFPVYFPVIKGYSIKDEEDVEEVFDNSEYFHKPIMVNNSDEDWVIREIEFGEGGIYVVTSTIPTYEK